MTTPVAAAAARLLPKMKAPTGIKGAVKRRPFYAAAEHCEQALDLPVSWPDAPKEAENALLAAIVHHLLSKPSAMPPGMPPLPAGMEGMVGLLPVFPHYLAHELWITHHAREIYSGPGAGPPHAAAAASVTMTSEQKQRLARLEAAEITAIKIYNAYDNKFKAGDKVHDLLVCS